MTHFTLVDTPELSPAIAMSRWREGRMTIEAVLWQTGCRSFAELWSVYKDMLEDEQQAASLMLTTAEDVEREEILSEVWERFGDYLREFVPPWENQDEIDRRLFPIIVAERQQQMAAVTAKLKLQ